MSLYASLSGIRIVSLEMTVPTWGLWCADVVLATEDVVPATCTLTVGNLTMAGAVVRQAPFAGARTARVVGGFGGWRKAVAARAYANPAGLPLSLLLSDLAAECGERVSVTADAVVGTYFIREAAKASRILKQLAGSQWWVDVAGVTRLGPRPTTKVTTEFLATQYLGAEGRFHIATEDLAAWFPGATFTAPTVQGTQTVSSFSVSMAKGGTLRLDVLAGAADRLMQGFSDLVDAEESADTFSGIWEYAVTSATATTFDGIPTAPSPVLPPLVGVPSRPGIAGATFTPAVGSLVLVAFANRDPKRPVVVSWDGQTPDGVAVDSTGSMAIGASASSVTLASGNDLLNSASAVGRVVRYGDQVTIPVSGAAALGVIALPPTPPTSPVSRVKA